MVHSRLQSLSDPASPWRGFVVGFAVALSILVCPQLAAPGLAAWSLSGNPVATGTQDQRYPKIVSDHYGGAIVLWEVNGMGRQDIWAQRIDSNGERVGSWPLVGLEVLSNPAPAGPGGWGAVSDGLTGAFVAWSQRATDSTNTAFVRRVLGAGSLSAAAVSFDVAGVVAGPYIAERGIGQAFLGWTHLGAPANTHRLQAIDADGTAYPGWPAGGAVIGGVRREWVVNVLADRERGAFLLAFEPRGNRGDLYLYRADSTGISPGWPTGGVLVGRHARLDGGYSLISSATGVIVVWEDWGTDSGGAEPDLLAQRFDASGTVATGWPADGLVVCNAPSYQTDPIMTPDGANGAVVAWSDYRDADLPFSELYAQRLLVSGTTAWTPNGVHVSTPRRQALFPTISRNGLGGFIITWETQLERGLPPDLDVFATCLLIDGTVLPGWPPDGLSICSEPGDQFRAAAVTTRTGTVMVAWTDGRDMTNDLYDIYAAQVTYVGQVGAGPGPLTMRAPVPNPTHGAAEVRFDLAQASDTWIEIFDLSGRIVRTLLEHESFVAGRHVQVWDGTDDDGRDVPTGMYFIRTRANMPGLDLINEASTRIVIVR